MRKVLLFVGTIVVLFFAVALLVPVLFKDRIVAAAAAELDRYVDATVAFEHADLTLISSFPDLELSFGGVTVTGRGPFEGVQLVRLGEARVALDLLGVVTGGTVTVRSIELTDADVHVLVDEEGRANYDIAAAQEGAPADAAPAAPTEPSTFALDLEEYVFTDVGLTYEDKKGGTLVKVEDLDASGRASVASDKTTFATRATIAALTVDDLLRRVAVEADLAVDLDAATGAITLGDNTLSLNALPLAFRGTVVPKGDDTVLDLAFEAKDTSFGALYSLVPVAYADEVKGLVTNGSIALQGAVKGTLVAGAEDHLPGFDLALQVNDGAFRYPSLPTSVDGIQLDLAVRHPEGGKDLTEIDLTRFAMNVGGSPVTGSVRLRNPMTDPDVAAKVVGTVDLALLRQALPPSPTQYEGRAELDLDVAGRVSQFTAQAVDQVTAKGTLRLDGVRYSSPEQPVPVEVERLLLTLDPRRADLAALAMRVGASDIRATGTVDNIVAYALTDATLVGRMDVTSSFLDLDAFAGGDASEEAEPAAGAPEETRGASAGSADGEESGVVVIPRDLDFALTARADKVRYGGHDASDVTGTFALKDGAVRIESLRMGILGGRVDLSGSYAAPTDEHADVDVRIDMVDFDVGATVGAFETLQEIVPVAKGARGRFNTGFRMQARLGRDLTPDLSTVFSDGRLRTKALALEPSFLSEVSEKLGNKAFRTLDLNDADLGFEMKEGRVKISPTSVKLGGVAATLGGSTGALDRTLDLDLGMKVPAGKLGAAGTGLARAMEGVGGPKDGTLDVKVKVGGTYQKPTVRLDLGSVTEAIEDKVAEVIDDATDRLLAEARAKGDALVAEAERAAAKVLAEAKKQGDVLRAEAKKKADKLTAEAKGNPLAEAAAKEAKKKVLAEADKQIAKLEGEAAAKAKSGVDGAKKEQARLLKEAETKAKAKK